MSTTFGTVGAVWYTNEDPSRGAAADDTERFQPLGRYSSGARVVYEKSTFQRRSWALSFVRVSHADLLSLLNFFRVVGGVSRAFTWRDHQMVVRTVRFTQPRIDYRQTGPDRYEATVGVFEDDTL